MAFTQIFFIFFVNNTCKFKKLVLYYKEAYAKYLPASQVFEGRDAVLEGGCSVKKGIHPEYKQTTITCACGEVIETGSTKENIQVEICSKCHPFFTGKQKLVDTGGRVEKFNRRFNRK